MPHPWVTGFMFPYIVDGEQRDEARRAQDLACFLGDYLGTYRVLSTICFHVYYQDFYRQSRSVFLEKPGFDRIASSNAELNAFS
jgi:hypothetical protein